MPDLYVANPPPSEKSSNSSFRLRGALIEPKKINFSTQRQGEKVLLVLRSHWVTNLGWIFLGIIFLFLPLALVKFPLIAFLPEKYQVLVLIGWYLLLVAYLFQRFLTWYFNIGIVTDQRVVDVDFYGLLYKEITDAELDKIEDVTEIQIGAVRTLFNFGVLSVQTAGENKMIEFSDIPNPRQVAKLLQDLR